MRTYSTSMDSMTMHSRAFPCAATRHRHSSLEVAPLGYATSPTDLSTRGGLVQCCLDSARGGYCV